MYLMVAGGILFTLEVLVILAACTPCEADDIIVFCLIPLVALTMFAVNIWGSVVVFGKLNEYTYLSLIKKLKFSDFLKLSL